ncbi:MAG: hypothetical protein WBA93_32485 [Microcoleaceae cyanobacterium]
MIEAIIKAIDKIDNPWLVFICFGLIIGTIYFRALIPLWMKRGELRHEMLQERLKEVSHNYEDLKAQVALMRQRDAHNKRKIEELIHQNRALQIYQGKVSEYKASLRKSMLLNKKYEMEIAELKMMLGDSRNDLQSICNFIRILKNTNTIDNYTESLNELQKTIEITISKMK